MLHAVGFGNPYWKSQVGYDINVLSGTSATCLAAAAFFKGNRRFALGYGACSFLSLVNLRAKNNFVACLAALSTTCLVVSQLYQNRGASMDARRAKILKEGQRLYKKAMWFELEAVPSEGSSPGSQETVFEIVDGCCIDVARREAEKGNGVCIIMAANPDVPGGEFLVKGSKGQEEKICRSSNLGAMMIYCKDILQRDLPDTFPLYGKSLFVPDVQFGMSEESFEVNVLASVPVREPGISKSGRTVLYSDNIVTANMRQFIYNQLLVAKDNGIDTVIAGAFGCNRCKNPPSLVALLYKEVIDKWFSGVFDKIVFAIEDSEPGEHNPEGNLLPFQRAFSGLI